ncbi:MAG: 3-oxoacyl-(acyl-carrier-protein) synthase, partial [Nonlabens sp.]
HCLAAAGSVELVGAVLQLREQKIYANSNITALHSKITDLIDTNCVPLQSKGAAINILAKASFGFGDVNACVILKNYNY